MVAVLALNELNKFNKKSNLKFGWNKKKQNLLTQTCYVLVMDPSVRKV